MSALIVRQALPEDAANAVDVLRASITEGCVEDHQHDPETLALWLHNKTVETFLRWLGTPTTHLIVAQHSSNLVGVAAINGQSHIHLLYVRPGFYRTGVGSALLAELERHALDVGASQITLESSITARSFYERHGYSSAGSPKPGFGISRAFPYAKALAR